MGYTIVEAHRLIPKTAEYLPTFYGKKLLST